MSIFLVDYENVSLLGLEGIEKLTEEDQVYIFYGNSAGSISFDMHAKIAQSRALVRYIKIERSGKNYLDFQLATLSGYLVATTGVTDFIIISKDTGFESVMDFWNQNVLTKQECQFKRWERISGRIEQKKENTSNRQNKRQKKNRDNKKNNQNMQQEHAEENKEIQRENSEVLVEEEQTLFPMFSEKTKEEHEKLSAEKSGIVESVDAKQERTVLVENLDERKEDFTACKEKTQLRENPLECAENVRLVENDLECADTEELREGSTKHMESVQSSEVTSEQREAERTKHMESVQPSEAASEQREAELPQKRKEKKRSAMKLEERYKKEIRELVRQDCHSPNDYSMIYKIIMRTNTTETFYAQMLAVFARERGSRLYEAILPVFGRILEEKIENESEKE